MNLTGGSMRGRKIETLPGKDIRPTSSKTRQALFNMLSHMDPPPNCDHLLHNQPVADICCGSGLLGFEALSRGAASITFVDNNRKSLSVAEHNAEKIRVAEQCRFILGDIGRLPTPPTSHTILFADPPYGKDLLVKLFDQLLEKPWLVPGGVCVVEMAARDPLPEHPSFALYKMREYGRTKIAIFRLDNA